jgi:hypothetical protein
LISGKNFFFKNLASVCPANLIEVLSFFLFFLLGSILIGRKKVWRFFEGEGALVLSFIQYRNLMSTSASKK